MIFNRNEALTIWIYALEGLVRLHSTCVIIQLAGDEKLIEMYYANVHK